MKYELRIERRRDGDGPERHEDGKSWATWIHVGKMEAKAPAQPK